MNTQIQVLDERHNEQSRLWQQAYQAWLQSQPSPQTRRKYEGILTEFFTFLRLSHPEGITPAQVTGSDCYDWKEDLKIPKVRHAKSAKLLANSDVTIENKLCALSSFYSFVCTYEIGAGGQTLHNNNPVARVERPEVKPYAHAKGASLEQVRQMLAACDITTVLGARDFAILLWFFFTARRRGAMTKMTWGDIRDGNVPGQKDYHYFEKRGEAHWRVLPPPVWQATINYLRLAERLASMTPLSPLFTPTNDHALRLPNVQAALGLNGNDTTKGLSKEVADGLYEQALDECSFNAIVKRVCKKAGLPLLTVHALRHAAALLHYEVEKDVLSVNRFLDHKSLDVTMRYLRQLMTYIDTTWEQKAGLILSTPAAENP
jgi:integrase